MTAEERELMQAHLNRVAEMRSQVGVTLDPALPTPVGRGSLMKMALLTVRDEMGLPLFVDGDNPDTECDPTALIRIKTPASKSTLIRRLMVSVPRVRTMRAA